MIRPSPALRTLTLVLALLLPGVRPRAQGGGETVVQDSGAISGFELHRDGAYWWRGLGVCGGEFPRQASITFAQADVALSAPTTLAVGCELLQHPHNNVVRDDLWAYFFRDRSLRRKFVGGLTADPGEPLPAPITFPVLAAGELGAYLELSDGVLYWGSYAAAGKRIDFRSLKTDGSEASLLGSLSNAGGPVAKLEWFQYRAASGRFLVTRSALAVLLEDRRLYRFDLADGTSTLLASGISDFALHRSQAFLGTEFTAYVFAAESDANPVQSPAVAPGRLWRIHAADPANRTLVYQAPEATRRQIVSVAVDPGNSGGLIPRRIYLADAPVDCSGLFCVLGNLSIRRATLPTPPADPGAWELIVNDNGGGSLRSDGQWLYYVDGRAVRRIKTDAPAVEFDLATVNLEVTQGLQDLAHSIDLIAGREGTVVRGYAHIAKDSVGFDDVFPDALLEVSYSVNGTPIPGSPFYPVNSARINGSSVLGALRSDPTRSFLFEVGALPAGLLRFEMILNPNENPAESGSNPYANNRAVRVLDVRQVGKACLVAIPLPTPAGTYDVQEADFPDMIRRAEALLPIRRLHLHCWQVLTDGGHVGDIVQDQFFTDITVEKDDGQDSEALDAVECVESSSSTPGGCLRANWVGLVHPGISGFNGLGNRPGKSSIARMVQDDFSDDWNEPRGGRSMAHELGHNFGRRHVDCGGPKDPDPFYPFAACSFAPDGETSFWGFDPITRTPIPPSFSGDLMSYRETRWTSPYTWNAIWNNAFLGGIPSPAFPGQFALAGLAAPPASILFVNGTLFLDQAVARFSASFQTDAAVFDSAKVTEAFLESAEAARQPDSFLLRLLDGAGTVVGETALPVATQEDGSEGRASFSHFVPWHPDTRRVQIVQAGTVWAELPVSEHPPVVALHGVQVDPVAEEIHVEWSGSDADGDPLVYLVQYSPDDGATWQTYRLNYRSTGLTLSTRMIAGGDATRFRVIASDGFRTGLATSAALALPNHPPLPLITGLREGERVPFGQPIDLYALVLDAEEGRLESDTRWDLAGPRSFSQTGDHLSLRDLAPGAYQVTASGRDRAGQQGAAVRHFEILPLTVADGPTPVVDGRCHDLGYAQATWVRASVDSGRLIPVRLFHADGALFVSFTGLPRGSRDLRSPLRVGVRVDVDPSDGSLASVDGGFYVDENGTPGVEGVSRTGLTPSSIPPSGFRAATHLTEKGWSAELRIPEEALGGWNHAVRLAFVVGTSNWPESATASEPAGWADTWLGPALSSVGANRTPTADAGAVQVFNVTTPRRVVLSGSNSRDPDGDPLQFVWSQTSGPSVTLEGGTTAHPAFVAEPPLVTTEYRFSLVVGDGSAVSLPAEAVVRVHPVARLAPGPSPGGEVTDQGFEGRLIGTAGRRYEVQASVDLLSWTTIETLDADPQGLIQFIDADPGRFDHRFYRAREVLGIQGLTK